MRTLAPIGLAASLSFVACVGGDDLVGSQELALGGALLPDIQEQIRSHLAIQNQQQREVLRFTTAHINTGAGPLQVHGGGQVAPCDVDGVHYDQCTIAMQEILDADGNVVATHEAGVALFHPGHNHWHQSAVATFEIRPGSLDAAAISVGQKVTFCLIDYEPLAGTSMKSRTYYECNGDLQGIGVGWSDQYHHSTEGQGLDVTGVPEGVYYLTHQADPDQHWLESDETNNFAWVRFRLTRKGANPEITVLETSPCSPGTTCGDGTNR